MANVYVTKSDSRQHYCSTNCQCNQLWHLFLNSNLDLEQHISNVCWTCFFQLWQMWIICRLLQPDMLKTLVHALAICWLDYGNSLFAGMPACDIQWLQSNQNTPVRLFGSTSKYDSIQPILCDVMHWLLVRERVNFKITLLMYKALNELASSYLSNMIILVSLNPVLRRNRLANWGDLAISDVKNTSYGATALQVQHYGTVCHLSSTIAHRCLFYETD